MVIHNVNGFGNSAHSLFQMHDRQTDRHTDR